MRQVLELHAASPVPRAVELLGSPGLELAGVTLALRAEPRAGDWWVRLHVQTPSGWTRVGELVTRALRTTGESPVLLATAAIPGATGWRLEAWPRLAALSNDRVLQAGGGDRSGIGQGDRGGIGQSDPDGIGEGDPQQEARGRLAHLLT